MRTPLIRRLFVATAAPIAIACLSAIAMPLPSSVAADRPLFQHPCASGESWELDLLIPDLGDKWKAEFKRSISGSNSPARGFSQALALRRQSAARPSAKLLAEYWISRALFSAKMIHSAYAGFSRVAAYPVRSATVSSTAPFQAAAFECMAQIRSKHPSLIDDAVPEAVLAARASELSAYFASDRRDDQGLQSVADFAFELLKANLANNPTRVDRALLSVIRSAGRMGKSADGAPSHPVGNARALLAEGIVAAADARHADAIQNLSGFLSQKKSPDLLAKHEDSARLLLARSLYSSGKFDSSIAELKKIRKSSNELSLALSELSWAYLMEGRYGEAIGTAMNFNAGGLRNTFAPEAPMVMAMAMNEICQFPDSLRSIQSFKNKYESSYRWLSEWNQAATPAELYPLAIQYIREKSSPLPSRVASEWIRSPVFLSAQGEINLLYDEQEHAQTLSRKGGAEQTALALQILEKWKEVQGRIRAERKGKQTRVPLGTAIIRELVSLKEQITDFRRFWHAAPAWRTILAAHEQRAPKVRATLIAQINRDLSRRSQRMLAMLGEIAENNQLIEVEIYQGASQDIVWQNANPGYREVAQQIKEQQQENSELSRQRVWNWGRAPASLSADSGESRGMEIWEDELGSFKADLVDNCSSKEKYLAIRHTGKES